MSLFLLVGVLYHLFTTCSFVFQDRNRIVEEVEVTKVPHELKRDNKVVAVLTPIGTTSKQQKNEQAIEKTLALAPGAGGF